MERISKDKAIKILNQKRISLFSIQDAKKIFKIEKEKTLYELLQRLEKAEIIDRIKNGKYIFLFRDVNDFELANFLVNPSYISLESALSFYGILPQFPYTITSVTILRTKKIIYKEKEYEFCHLEKKYFFGFVKIDKFLIATPEKALIDELYFMSKNLRKIYLKDLDLSLIDKVKFKKLIKKYNFMPFKNLIKKLKI